MRDHVRRRVAAGAVLTLLAGGTALTPSSSAQATGGRHPQSVVSGEARFQVLSPTRKGVAWGGEAAMRTAFGKVRRQLRK